MGNRYYWSFSMFEASCRRISPSSRFCFKGILPRQGRRRVACLDRFLCLHRFCFAKDKQTASALLFLALGLLRDLPVGLRAAPALGPPDVSACVPVTHEGLGLHFAMRYSRSSLHKCDLARTQQAVSHSRQPQKYIISLCGKR